MMNDLSKKMSVAAGIIAASFGLLLLPGVHASAETVVNVADFGALPGDGIDDTAQINRAIESLESGGVVNIPAGEYNIDATNGNLGDKRKLGIVLKSNVTLNMNGAIFTVKGNNAENYQVISIRALNNVTINGGVINGERNSHKGKDGESGHGVCIWDSNNVTINNMTINNNWSDGIYIGSQNDDMYKGCSGITINNCKINNNRRNGITIAKGSNVDITKCTIKNKKNGIAPNSCIHLEANGKYVFKNINISNTKATNANYSSGSNKNFVFYTHNDRKVTAKNVKITGCTFKGYFMNYSAKKLLLKNCKIQGTLAYKAKTVLKKTTYKKIEKL